MKTETIIKRTQRIKMMMSAFTIYSRIVDMGDKERIVSGNIQSFALPLWRKAKKVAKRRIVITTTQRICVGRNLIDNQLQS